MAGEWLKFESSLPEKPETLAITVAMGWDDPDLTVGKLMRLFRWFDQHTVDGNAASVTPALLDRLIGVTGFVQAVANAGWLDVTDIGLSLINFDRHNGTTAKSRAQTAKRVANHRANAGGGDGCNAASVTPTLAREEKRREEKRERKKPATDVPDIPPALLSDFLSVRKAKRAGPLTKTALDGLKREADKAGLTLSEAVAYCCEVGWQGFNAAWHAERTKDKSNGVKSDHVKRGSEEYAALHRNASWWREAGFDGVWSAIAVQCWHDNANEFRDGKRVGVAA